MNLILIVNSDNIYKKRVHATFLRVTIYAAAMRVAYSLYAQIKKSSAPATDTFPVSFQGHMGRTGLSAQRQFVEVKGSNGVRLG